MSLYVRVLTSFYTHRKTARLRAILGNDALWIPPRLWAYAAQNQPDGNFKDYSAKEIAMALEYAGDAQAMLEAMLQAGFLDKGLKIHDWAEHNGYHQTFADRAVKAATARWNKVRPPVPPEKKGPDKIGKETSIATSNASSMFHPDSRTCLFILNEACGKHFRETDSNLAVISARLNEGGVDVAGVRLMVTRQCKRWLNTDQAEYLRPETLFGKTKFDGYYAAREQPIHENHPRNNRPSSDRNSNNSNSKVIGQYDGVGKVL